MLVGSLQNPAFDSVERILSILGDKLLKVSCSISLMKAIFGDQLDIEAKLGSIVEYAKVACFDIMTPFVEHHKHIN